MPDDRKNVTDRVASRFDSDDADDREAADTREGNERNAKRVKNVKKEWNAKSIYVPDELDNQLSKTFKRLDLELDESIDKLKKTRHFYPLVISEGLEQIESMEQNEIMERIERIEQQDT